VTAELRYGRGIYVGKEQVHLLMKRLGIYGLPKRRLPRGARVGKASSLDLVRRRFSAEGPDRLWMTDITEHPTREGKIYCCAVIDAFSRMVVGWSIDGRQTGLLVTNALGMALRRRTPREGGIIHSDQGVRLDSTGRRNVLMVEVFMGRPAGWMKELTGRTPMKSPGSRRCVATWSGCSGMR
jgi:putative transposase